jgi:hypothetical protein
MAGWAKWVGMAQIKYDLPSLGRAFDTWASMAQPDVLSGTCRIFLSGTSTILMGHGPCRHSSIYRTKDEAEAVSSS